MTSLGVCVWGGLCGQREGLGLDVFQSATPECENPTGRQFERKDLKAGEDLPPSTTMHGEVGAAQRCDSEVGAAERSGTKLQALLWALAGAGDGGGSSGGARRGAKRERGWEVAFGGTTTGVAAPKRTLTGDKPYACCMCGQRFRQSGLLKVHERTHTGEKPYACGVCGRRYRVSGDLNVHERSHTAGSGSARMGS